jgi:peptidoglycan/LPS O-acetylase OafA/YrhL
MACNSREIDSSASRNPISSGPPPRPARAEVRALTGLRGVAALLVALYHINPELIAPTAAGRFVGKGYLWVDLFFVLSGFLLAMNYASRFAGGWRLGAWLDFLLHRVARIYPLYLVLVAASLAYSLLLYGGLHAAAPPPAVALSAPARDVAANLLMVQSWGLGESIDGVAWSLSTEWAAYLVFPLLVAAALFGRPRAAVAAALGAIAVVVATVTLTSHDGAYHSGPLDAYDGATLEPLLRCLGGFVLGLVTYRLSRSPRATAIAGHDLTIAAALGLLVAGLAAGVHDLLIYPLFALLVLGLFGNRGYVGWLFGCRPVYWVGVVSYSIYLLHPYLVAPRARLDSVLQGAFPEPCAQLVTAVVIYGLLFATSALAYHAIEEPGRRWVRSLRGLISPLARGMTAQ